ncbi:MAG TPA: hypothetical protein VK894_10750 [Jiangellales bacterium]|nr:hypothetical protein [Jiangellales bacterium]
MTLRARLLAIAAALVVGLGVVVAPAAVATRPDREPLPLPEEGVELPGCGSTIILYPDKTNEKITFFYRRDGVPRFLVTGQFIVRVVHPSSGAEVVLNLSGTARATFDDTGETTVLTGRNLLYQIDGFGDAILITDGRLVLEIDYETGVGVLTSPPARMYDLCEVLAPAGQ